MKAAMLGDNCIDVYRMIDGREVNRQYPTGNVVDTGVNLQKLGIPTTVVSMNPIMVDGTGMCGACRLIVGDEVKWSEHQGSILVERIEDILNSLDVSEEPYLRAVQFQMLHHIPDELPLLKAVAVDDRHRRPLG